MSQRKRGVTALHADLLPATVLVPLSPGVSPQQVQVQPGALGAFLRRAPPAHAYGPGFGPELGGWAAFKQAENRNLLDFAPS